MHIPIERVTYAPGLGKYVQGLAHSQRLHLTQARADDKPGAVETCTQGDSIEPKAGVIYDREPACFEAALLCLQRFSFCCACPTSPHA